MVQSMRLEVDFGRQRIELPYYRLGPGEAGSGGEGRVLIVGGVHGWEHTGMATGYELVRCLESRNIRGTVDVLPVANTLAFGSETRETQEDGINMGNAFGEREPRSITGALANNILGLASGADLVLDLHSAGEARYVQHVIFSQMEDSVRAASFGLPFALLRTKTREGKSEGTLTWAVHRQGGQAFSLELGAGIAVYCEDVSKALRHLISFLIKTGFLEAENDSEILPDTPQDRIFMDDLRHFVRAREEGAFYPKVALGDAVSRDQEIGIWIPVRSFQLEKVASPCNGMVVYMRIRSRTHTGNTICMLLPLA